MEQTKLKGFLRGIAAPPALFSLLRIHTRPAREPNKHQRFDRVAVPSSRLKLIRYQKAPTLPVLTKQCTHYIEAIGSAIMKESDLPSNISRTQCLAKARAYDSILREDLRHLSHICRSEIPEKLTERRKKSDIYLDKPEVTQLLNWKL